MADPRKPGEMPAATRILLCLQQGGPMTVAELAEFAGRSQTAIRNHLGRLRKTDSRQVRIIAWEQPEPPSGQWSAVYAPGSARDVKRPPAKTPQQKCRQYAAKVSVVRAAKKRAERTGQTASPWDALLRLAA